MNREEFLRQLEKALQGEVSPQVLRSNLQYYRDYISAEIARGRSEREVLNELGDPRLIARTIVEAADAAGNSGTSRRENAGTDYGRGPSRRDSTAADYGRGYGGGYGPDPGEPVHVPFFRTWKGALVIAVIVVFALLVISLVFSVAWFVLTSPVFWLLIIVWLVWRAVAGRKYRRL